MKKKERIITDMDLIKISSGENCDVIEVGIRRFNFDAMGPIIKVSVMKKTHEVPNKDLLRGDKEKIQVVVEADRGCWGSQKNNDLGELAVMAMIGYMYIPTEQLESMLSGEGDFANVLVDFVKDPWIEKKGCREELKELAFRLAQALYHQCYVGIGAPYFTRKIFEEILKDCRRKKQTHE